MFVFAAVVTGVMSGGDANAITPGGVTSGVCVLFLDDSPLEAAPVAHGSDCDYYAVMLGSPSASVAFLPDDYYDAPAPQLPAGPDVSADAPTRGTGSGGMALPEVNGD